MKNKNTVWPQILLIYLICFCFRFIEYFFIRTDSTFFGEAFIHKLLGIVVLFVSARLLLIKPVAIGFSRNKLPQNLLKGFLLGLCCYTFAYAVEIIILKNAGSFEKLSLFVTSYSVNGNLGNHTEAVFFLICILGNNIPTAKDRHSGGDRDDRGPGPAILPGPRLELARRNPGHGKRLRGPLRHPGPGELLVLRQQKPQGAEKHLPIPPAVLEPPRSPAGSDRQTNEAVLQPPTWRIRKHPPNGGNLQGGNRA